MHSSFIYKRYYNKPRCALPSYRLNSNTHIYTTSTLLYLSVVKREKLLIHTICISHQITEGKKLIHSLHTVWFQLSNCWSDKFFFFNGGQISGFQQLRQEIRGSWVCLIKGKHERSQWCWNSSASWLWWWIHKPKQMIKLYRTHTHTRMHIWHNVNILWYTTVLQNVTFRRSNWNTDEVSLYYSVQLHVNLQSQKICKFKKKRYRLKFFKKI